MTANPAATAAGVQRPRAVPPRGAWARHRELLLELIRRDLKARYRGSRLGIAWSLLNPLLFMVVYSIVFTFFVRFKTKAPYPVFLLSGLLAWNFFGQALGSSVNSILASASLVKKVAFPWVLITLSSVIATFVNYLISLVLLIPLVVFFRVAVDPAAVALLPLIILLMFSMTLGLCLLVAAANVYFRDLEYLVGVALTVGFFMTPVIYTLQSVEQSAGGGHRSAEAFKWLLYANPMTWVAVAFQDIIANHEMPTRPLGLLYTTAFAIVALPTGILVFNRLRRRFAEEL